MNNESEVAQKEEWMHVDGFDWFYQVSDKGRVRSSERLVKNRFGTALKKAKILKQNLGTSGYLGLNLFKNKIGKTVSVHQIVATAFIPNPENRPCVNHIDGNKLNNDKDNLEWCTYSENNRHSYDIGISKRGSANSLAKLTEEQVLYIRSETSIRQQDAADMFSVSRQTIQSIRARESWKHI